MKTKRTAKRIVALSYIGFAAVLAQVLRPTLIPSFAQALTLFMIVLLVVGVLALWVDRKIERSTRLT